MIRSAKLRIVKTATLEIAFEEGGPTEGRPVVLLHGFPDDPRSWDGVVAPLINLGFKTVVPYLRGFGPTRFVYPDTPRSGQQAALAYDVNGLIDRLNLPKPILCGFDWGARAACTTSVLWPAKIGGLITIGGYNVEDLTIDQQPASAEQEQRGWYQWYFHTHRGRKGLERNRRGFCRLLWQLWSPNWKFSDAEFEETAASFDNPDFVEIVIHSYRHRYGVAPGDPELEGLEKRLVGQPPISVPTIVLHGEGDGVHSDSLSEDQEELFSGSYERRLIPRVGHLFPREAPEAVVQAVQDLS